MASKKTLLPTPPIWVDFMARDGKSRVHLDFPGTLADLKRHAMSLNEGMRITLYTEDATDVSDPDDLVTVGIVQRDPTSNRWFAVFDWTTLLHVSDLDATDRRRYESAKAE